MNVLLSTGSFIFPPLGSAGRPAGATPVVGLFVRIRVCHREASLAVGTASAFAGRLGSFDGAALDQVSPASGCGGVGLDGGTEDAHAAESTSDERVRTRAPSVFFMAT